MVIRILDIVPGADTAEQGESVYCQLQDALANYGSVTVSFDRLNIATSSFVATAFLPLLEQYSFSDLKQRLHVIDSTRQINQMIKSRMEREAAKAA